MQPQRPRSAKPHSRRKRPCTAPSKRSSSSAVEEGHAATRSRAARHGEAMQPWWMAGNSNADEDNVDGEGAFDKKANEAMDGIVRWESDEILPLQPFIGVVIREAPQAATCAVDIPQKKARSPKRSRSRPASACVPKEKSVLSHQMQYAKFTEPPLRFAPTHEERAPILQRRPHNHTEKKLEKVAAKNQNPDLPSTEDRVEQSRPGRPHEQSEGTIAFPFSAKLGKSFCKVREMRQNIALHSAVLAFKHQIEHPKAKLSHELKRDRLRTLEQQSLADRTRVLASYVAKDSGPESEQGPEPETSGSAHDTDRNSFAFGWDAISNPDYMRGNDHSAVIWDNVAKHLDISILLQEVYNAKPEMLPSVSSTHKAFSLLKTVTELVEDDLVASALTAVGQVLTSAAFCPRSTSGCCSEQTSEELNPGHAKSSFYFESQEKLVSENAEMRERLGVLEAEIRQQNYLIEELQKSSNRNVEQERHDEEAKRKNSPGPSRATVAVEALQHTLARVAPHARDRTDVVLELYRTGSVPVDELTIAGLFGLLEEDAVPDALRLVLQECISKESAVEAVCCTLQREDAVAVAQRAMEKDPGVERIFCLQARSLTRLISFWELHWGKFCDVLWFSPELLRTMVVSRPEVAGKFLKVYCQWLAQGNGAKVMFERHRSVMEEILNQVVDFGPSFLEATLVRNRQTLRDILESKSAGEDLLETLADSSPHIVGTILDFSQSTLGDSLTQRADLLGQVTAQNAAWLLAFLRKNQEVVSRTLCTDVGLLPGLIASSPMLMDALVRNSTEELGFHVAGHAEAIVAALAQAPCETLEKDVLAAHPKLLLGDKARLERLGLRNLAAYHSSCVAQASQTDPVSSAQISGHGQARSLVEIVGKRKARSDGWTLDELESTIAQVYQEKIDADAIDDRAGHAREPLSEVVYDHFLSKEDDVAATKRALAAFTVALRSMADTSTTVRWFGVLVGAIDAERYSTQAESFFLSLVRALVPYKDVGECIDSSEGQTLLPFLQVLNAVMGIASMYWYEISDREALMDRLGELQQYEVANSDLLGELESNRLWAKYTEEDLQSARSGMSLMHASTTDSSSTEAVEDASGIPKDEAREEEEGAGMEMEVAEDAQRGSLTMKSIVQTRIMSQSNQLASNIFSMMRGRRHSSARQLAAQEQAANPMGKKETLCVSLHDVLDVVMRAWYAMEKSEYDTLCEIFKSGDANGDGILDMNEWELLVLVVDPQADPRTVRRMFKMTGEENEDGEHIITPSEFVQVMRAHKYTGPALAHLRSKILASRSGKGD